MSMYTSPEKIMTRDQPTIIVQNEYPLYRNGRIPYCAAGSNGLKSRNEALKLLMPSLPPKYCLNRTERTTSRTISAVAIVTIAR